MCVHAFNYIEVSFVESWQIYISIFRMVTLLEDPEWSQIKIIFVKMYILYRLGIMIFDVYHMLAAQTRNIVLFPGCRVPLIIERICLRNDGIHCLS